VRHGVDLQGPASRSTMVEAMGPEMIGGAWSGSGHRRAQMSMLAPSGRRNGFDLARPVGVQRQGHGCQVRLGQGLTPCYHHFLFACPCFFVQVRQHPIFVLRINDRLMGRRDDGREEPIGGDDGRAILRKYSGPTILIGPDRSRECRRVVLTARAEDGGKRRSEHVDLHI